MFLWELHLHIKIFLKDVGADILVGKSTYDAIVLQVSRVQIRLKDLSQSHHLSLSHLASSLLTVYHNRGKTPKTKGFWRIVWVMMAAGNSACLE